MREQSVVASEVFTVRGQEADRITGFEAGTDDYVTTVFVARTGRPRQSRFAPPARQRRAAHRLIRRNRA